MGALTTRRVVAVCATLGLLALMSFPAFAEGRRPKMDGGVAARVGTSGTSRVIVRLRPAQARQPRRYGR